MANSMSKAEPATGAATCDGGASSHAGDGAEAVSRLERLHHENRAALGRSLTARNVLMALTQEIDLASSSMEEGMLDVSVQFRSLAERALRQAEDLQAIAQGAHMIEKAPEQASVADLIDAYVAGMVESIGVMAEQSALIGSVLQDLAADQPSHVLEVESLIEQIRSGAKTIEKVGEALSDAWMPGQPEQSGDQAPSVRPALDTEQREDLTKGKARIAQGQATIAGALARSAEVSALVTQSVPSVTQAIQFQDTAKQRIDNVRGALDIVAASLGESAAELNLEAAMENDLVADHAEMLERVVGSVTLGDMAARLSETLLGRAVSQRDPDADTEIELF